MDENSRGKKIKSKNSKELSSLRYRKRKGTTDLGKLYEEYFPAYVVLQLLQNNEVKDFRISTNDENFGAFDDFVLEVQQINKPTEKYAIQLKHISSRELTINNLKTGKNFNIMKYYVSFQENNELLSEYKLILCTNSKFTPNNDATIDLIGSDKSVIKVKITECVPLQFLNTEFGKSFRFQLDSRNSEEIKEKYKGFFDRLFLYTDQMKAQKLEQKYIPQFLGKLTSKSSVQDKFLKFISKWSQIDGTKDKLTKEMMIKVITLNIVEELIQPHTFCEVNEKQKLFRNAMSHFNITAFGRRSLENVVKIWGDSKDRFRDHNIKEINEIIRRFQICTKHIENMDDLTDEESTKLLWVMDECPLIIKGDYAAYEAVKLCEKNSKFVFITDELHVEKLEEFTIFKTISDLKYDESTYNNILKNLTFTLFGEKTNLENLIKNDDALDNDLITTDEIAKIVDNVDLIKLEEEELCFPYVERHLYKNIIDSKYLQKIDKNTMVLISDVSDEEKLKENLQTFEFVPIRKKLHKDTDGTTNSNDNEKFEINQDHRSEKHKLFFNKTEITPEEFTNLCKKNKKYQKFYHFKYHDKHLEWIESIGDVSDLQFFFIQNDNFIEDEKLCAQKISKNLNIIVGDPGMGKSTFMKMLKNNLLSKYFTVMIRPIDVPELCRFMKDANPQNLQKFFTFIVESKFSNYGNFQKQILKQLMKKGKAVFLWDALDELTEENRIFVEKLIAALLKKSLSQFLTSRGFLRKQLEDNFKIISQQLRPFNDKQQTDYIHRRLQDICSREELESITTAIKENISNTSYREILGIPLQIYMLTDLFIQNLEKYRRVFTELFVITDLYCHFVEEKFEVYFKKGTETESTGSYKDNISRKRMVSGRKKSYQKVALKLLFESTFLEKTSADLNDFLEEVEKEGDEFGLITAVDNEMQPQFLHNSYAEYFAATYLAENCRNIPNLENVIFDRKYANVRYFFDTLLARDSPIHIAVLCKNLSYIQNCEDRDEWKQKDLAGRNALHLAASWGERYPLLETTKLDDSTTFGATILIHDGIKFETKKENFEYFQIIETSLENCDPEEEDQLLKWTPTQYAKKCECLLALARIVKKQENHSSLETQSKKFVYSLLYYEIKYGFQDFLSSFANIEFARTESGSTLLHMAVENNHFQYLKKLLEHEVFKQNIDYKNQHGETPLFQAALRGHLETVKYLVQEHTDVNAATNDGWTPLHAAAVYGHIETVKYLIQEHANVNAADNDGRTPLHAAAAYGHIETVKYLIQEHADVSAANRQGRTPLHAAAYEGHLETVKYLIQEHADVNAATNDGRTPLHAAATNGHLETMKYLIQEHANVNAATNDGWTPLHRAALNGHTETVKYLIQEHANVNAANRQGRTPLHAAAYEGHLETVKYLIQEHADVNAATNDGWTPLHAAATNGHLETVKYLIQEHANVNAATNDGWTPLHCAALNGHTETVKYLIQEHANVNAANRQGQTPLHAPAYEGHLETVKYLIQEHADVNAATNDGRTPLHAAATNGHLETVKYLIQEHANVNAATNDGWTPLHCAALNGHTETVKYLIQEHANVNAANRQGQTPLHAPAYEGHLETVKYLIQEHADVNAATNDGRTPLHAAATNGHLETVKYLIQEHANVNAATNDGWTPLHAAAEDGHIETVKYLIQEHANVNAATNDGWTPLHRAALNGHTETVKYLIQEHANVNAANRQGQTPLHAPAYEGHLETVKYLIQEHADVNAATNDGRTPLHAAATNGHLETVKYLIQEHANVNAATNDGWTPLHAAAEDGHIETVKYLIEKGANIIAITSDGTTVLWSASFGGLLETVIYLTEQNLNADAADGDDSTPLMVASKKGHLDIVRFLIQQKADINASDKNGFTPLHWASDQEHLSIVELLIKEGANVDVNDENFETPLTKACARGNEAIVQFLIQSDANVNCDEEGAENRATKNPLHMACENGHKKIVEILLEAGADYETPTVDGQTYIDVAIRNNHEDIAELLRTHKNNFTKNT